MQIDFSLSLLVFHVCFANVYRYLVESADIKGHYLMNYTILSGIITLEIPAFI